LREETDEGTKRPGEKAPLTGVLVYGGEKAEEGFAAPARELFSGLTCKDWFVGRGSGSKCESVEDAVN
jgi:hypothetical protein